MFSDKNLEFHQNVNQKNKFLSFSKITNTNTRVSFTVHNFKITKIKRGFTFLWNSSGVQPTLLSFERNVLTFHEARVQFKHELFACKIMHEMFCPFSQKHEVSLGCGTHLLFFVYIVRKFHAKTAWNWRFCLMLFLPSKMKKADSFMILRCIILWIRKSQMEKNVTDRAQLRRVRRFNLFPNRLWTVP